MSDEKALEWLNQYLLENKIDMDKLSPAQQFLLMREIPCTIRCWRVGGPVEVERGKKCPECGKLRPLRTSWERILEDNDDI